MSVRLARETVQGAVKTAAPFLGKYPEINRCLEFDTRGGSIKLRAYGDSGTLTLVLPGSTEKEGSFAVRADLFAGIASRLTEPSLLIKAGRDQRLSLAAGRNNYTLPGVLEPTRPVINAGIGAGNALLPGEPFLECLNFVLHAASRGDVRHWLNGVYVVVQDGSMTFTATDGHRLARAQHTYAPLAPTDKAGPAIIPIGTATKLVAAMEGSKEVLLWSDGDWFRMSNGDGFDFVGSCLSGRYPDTATVIPDGGTPCTTNFQALLTCMERAALLHGDIRNRGVDLIATARAGEGTMEVKFDRNAEFGFVSMDDRIDCTLPEGPGAGTARLNPDYLRDALIAFGAASDTVLYFNPSSVHPFKMLAKNGERVALIMPLRPG